MSQSGKLVILVSFVLLLGLTLFHNTKDTLRYLSHGYVRKKPGFVSLCQSTTRGRNAVKTALLCKLLSYNLNSNQIKLIIPSYYPSKYRFHYLKSFRVLSGTMQYGAYASKYCYPIEVKAKKYRWLLRRDEFELLKSKLVFLEEGHFFKYYISKELLKFKGEVGIFAYKYNIVVVPMNYKAEKR